MPRARRFRLLALGAALSYFFDPENGKRRRKVTADRVAALLRRHGGRLMKGTGSQAHALKQKATHLREEPKPQPDDVTLARKVETEIFRGADVPKGKINVTVSLGVAAFPEASDADNLVAAADGALYEAKRAGKNRVKTAAPRARQA